MVNGIKFIPIDYSQNTLSHLVYVEFIRLLLSICKRNQSQSDPTKWHLLYNIIKLSFTFSFSFCESVINFNMLFDWCSLLNRITSTPFIIYWLIYFKIGFTFTSETNTFTSETNTFTSETNKFTSETNTFTSETNTFTSEPNKSNKFWWGFMTVCPVKFKERLGSGAFSSCYQDGDDEGKIGRYVTFQTYRWIYSISFPETKKFAICFFCLQLIVEFLGWS